MEYEQENCPSCMEDWLPTDVRYSCPSATHEKCKSTFHLECLKKWVTNPRTHFCPMCRRPGDRLYPVGTVFISPQRVMPPTPSQYDPAFYYPAQFAPRISRTWAHHYFRWVCRTSQHKLDFSSRFRSFIDIAVDKNSQGGGYVFLFSLTSFRFSDPLWMKNLRKFEELRRYLRENFMTQVVGSTYSLPNQIMISISTLDELENTTQRIDDFFRDEIETGARYNVHLGSNEFLFKTGSLFGEFVLERTAEGYAYSSLLYTSFFS